MNEFIEEFADQLGVDVEEVEDRWQGRPDRMMEDLFRVPNEEGDLQQLELYPYQRRFVKAYFYGDAATITWLKGRRIGGSFIVVLCLLLEGIMMPGAIYPIVSTKEKQAFSRIRDIKELVENAVIEIPLAKKPTQSEIRLWNGTRYEAYTGSPSGARGDGARSVFLDEMAHIEDQESMVAAFNPMLARSSGKLLQVSTPLAPNDLFMRDWKRGSPSGENGMISLFQPTFNNADEIDPEVSLFDQEIDPAFPELNIGRVEDDRLKDPQKFAQEYLCQSADESYRFFDPNSIRASMERSREPNYAHGEFCGPQKGGTMVMGVDVATTHDDTVAAVFEHVDDRRYQRHIEVVDEASIAKAGIAAPDRGNPEHVVPRLVQLADQMGVDYFVIDKTSYGEGVTRMLESRLGSAVIGFNFSDKDAVADMMGDMNAALRSDRVVLIDDPELEDQLCSIVKEQKEYQKPRFSGKDYSESGKDDMAMACVLAAFPPGFSVQPSTGLAEKRTSNDYAERSGAGSASPTGTASRHGPRATQSESTPVYGATAVQRQRPHSYTARYARNRRSRW